MKKVCLFLLSAVLTVAMAFGLVACGNTPSGTTPGGDSKPGGDNPPPAPPTPTVTVDVAEITLILGESVTVTATVTNSEKVPVFTLEGTTVASVTVPENGKTATVKGLSAGNTKLTVSLEGAQSVEVPVKVENAAYRFNAAAALKDDTKVFDAGVTGVDDGETATVNVVHFIEGAKVEAVSNNESVATVELNEDTATATVKTHQAGVAEITVTLKTVKQAEEEQPAPAADEEEPALEYEELHSETYTVVCTDDWDKEAKAFEEDYSTVFGYREVTGGYQAYILPDADATDIGLVNGELRVPAIYNRKPVVSIGRTISEISMLKLYFAGMQAPLTQEQIDALDDEEKKTAEQDYKNAYDANAQDMAKLAVIFASIKSVYLPCTLTRVPELSFRLSEVETVVFQEGSHITEIGIQAFNEARFLKSINLDALKELKTIKTNAFNQAGNGVVSGVTATWQDKEGNPVSGFDVYIPNSVTLIEMAAFENSAVKKLEFQEAKTNGEGAYVPGIVLQNGQYGGQPNATFGECAILETVILRNIKNLQAEGNGYCLFSGWTIPSSIKEFTFGEDVLVSAFNGTTQVYTFNWAFCHKDGVSLIFEGTNNDVIRNIAALSGALATFGDNMGGMLSGGFTATTGHSINVTKIYVQEDVTDDSVSSYIKGMYTKQDTSDKEGYTLWTKKAA